MCWGDYWQKMAHVCNMCNILLCGWHDSQSKKS